MNCISLKQKLNRTLYCKYKKKDIKISECSDCVFKKYKNVQYNVKISEKNTKMHNKIKNTVQIKNKTYRLVKMERNRFSIFTDDLDHCIICGKPNTNKHEIFFGSKHRQLSIKYGLVIPLCTAEHHNQIDKKGIHFDKMMQDYWHKKGQTRFKEVYPNLDFVNIFKRNYL